MNFTKEKHMENWYKEVRAKTEFVFQAIITDDFVVKIMNGTLPKDVFDFYINQDSLYLAEYKKALVAVAVKCQEQNDIQFFLESATGIIAVENALHQFFLDTSCKDGIPSPTCELYTSYLARVIDNYSVEVGLAVILPCFTVYQEVGEYILQHQKNKDDNIYQNWIDTYGGEEFDLVVKKAIEITNKYASRASVDTLLKMEEVFVKTSKLEWMFWESAYRREKWPI